MNELIQQILEKAIEIELVSIAYVFELGGKNLTNDQIVQALVEVAYNCRHYDKKMEKEIYPLADKYHAEKNKY